MATITFKRVNKMAFTRRNLPLVSRLEYLDRCFYSKGILASSFYLVFPLTCTFQVPLAGVESGLPGASVARTRKVWEPLDRPV